MFSYEGCSSVMMTLTILREPSKKKTTLKNILKIQKKVQSVIINYSTINVKQFATTPSNLVWT